MSPRKKFIPRAYQPLMVDHTLDVKRCAVWAGMGLGKTVSELTALDHLFISGMETKPALVCAPLRVAQNTWPDEVAKWDHLSGMEVLPIVGSPGERKSMAMCALADLKRGNTAVYTVNYENMPWLIQLLEDEKQPWPFGTVIADESTKLKGFRIRQGSVRARALARVAHAHCSRFIELSGTPSPNGLQDLWGQIYFLDAGKRLGLSFESFKNRWFHPKHDGYGIQPADFSQKQIEAKLKDICISLHAKDYFDLKDPISVPVYVDLPPKARALYDDMEETMFMQIEEHKVEALNAAARTMKCLQLANGAAYVDQDVNDDEAPRAKQWVEVHDEKILALEDVIEEAAGMPVMVAYHFRSDLARLQKAFPKGRVLDKNPSTLREWNAGTIPILFAHPASAGHGLNLQDGGNILVFFAHNWNLEEFQQIIERIGPTRQLQAGHDRNVFIYHIIARDTIEEQVMERMDSKRKVQDLLLEAMKRKRKRRTK